MKIKIIFILFSFNTLNINLYSQHLLSGNLVPNPSFEEYISCPYQGSQIWFATPWTPVRNDAGSSDYINNCTTFYDFIIFLQKKSPRTGDGCAGIFVMMNPILSPEYREYIGVKLKNKLKPEKKYCSSFYTVFLYFYGSIAIENIGLFYSFNYSSINNSSIWLIDSVPQIENNKGLITDSINWTKVSGVFEAIGNEEYITIGNFNNDNITNWIQFDNSIGGSYYYIDDVSVCECSFDINLGADSTLCEGENIILNPNLPNATYTWQDSSHVATYEVKQPGTYWVRAYVADYDITTTDTIVIKAGNDSYCNPPLTIPNIITPNGDNKNDNFQILNSEYYEIALQIYNRWGVLLYECSNYQNNYNCNNCADGVYFYVLKAKSKRNGREKEYKGSLTIING